MNLSWVRAKLRQPITGGGLELEGGHMLLGSNATVLSVLTVGIMHWSWSS